jgi:hypothetical protein
MQKQTQLNWQTQKPTYHTNQQKPAKRTNNLVEGSCYKKIAEKSLVKRAEHLYSRQVNKTYSRPAKILLYTVKKVNEKIANLYCVREISATKKFLKYIVMSDGC